jgi:arylsulfatase A-like enzyme
LSTSFVRELHKLIPTLKHNKDSFEHLIALYDSETSYADHYIGDLLSQLQLNKNTLIIITSDHGEEFLDHHSLGHGHTLYQELLRVPLIVNLPYASKNTFAATIDEPVSIIDILPSILGALGETSPEELQGIDIIETKKTAKDRNRDYLFAELEKADALKAIINKKWKYIYDYKNQKGQLYNIMQDHHELQNMIHLNPSIAKALQKELFNWVSLSEKNLPETKKVGFPKEIEEKLKALGYITNGELDAQVTEGCHCK